MSTGLGSRESLSRPHSTDPCPAAGIPIPAWVDPAVLGGCHVVVEYGLSSGYVRGMHVRVDQTDSIGASRTVGPLAGVQCAQHLADRIRRPTVPCSAWL